MPPILQAVSRVVPLTYAVALLKGVWLGEGWSGHLDDVAVLCGMFVVFTTVSARVFRWG